MEINARVYLMADERFLLEEAGDILDEMNTTFTIGCAEEFKPSLALPLSCVWFGTAERAEPTHGPEYWEDCLQACADVLGKHGAVVVEFRSPDHPDGYLEYAATTSGGHVTFSQRAALNSYRKSLGNDDVSLVLEELMKGSTYYDRRMAAKRAESKDAIRAQKGDFEIVGDKLVKYHGIGLEETIPEGVRIIGEEAFADLNQLEKVFMGDLDEYDAPELVKLTIPEGVEIIETYAIAYCEYLESVNIPSTVKKIGIRAFEGCNSLRSIQLPTGLKEIESYTFFLCDELQSVTIPEGVEKIGEGAFYACSSLKKLIIPESVKEIEKDAFKGCDGLRQVTLPEHLKPQATQIFFDSPNVKITAG